MNKKIVVAHIHTSKGGALQSSRLRDLDLGETQLDYYTYLCQHQGRLGTSVTLYTYSKNTSEFVINYKRYSIKFEPVAKLHPLRVFYLYSPRCLPHEISLRLVKEVLKDTPDIIHFHGSDNYYLMFFLLAIMAKLKEIRFVAHVRGPLRYWSSFSQSYSNFKLLIFKLFGFYKCFLDFVAYRLVAKVIVENFDNKKILQRKLGIEINKINIIPSGIDAQLFKPLDKDGCRKKLGLKQKGKYLLWVSRLSPARDIGTVLKAIRQLEDINTIVVGTGSELPRLQDLVKSLGMQQRVIFTGFVPNKVLPLYYNAADCFISHVRKDSWGVAVLEAMACRTPVIACKGTPAMKSSGYSIPFQNENAIAKAVKQMCSDSRLREKFAKMGYDRSKNFSLESIGKQILNLYHSLCES